MTYELSSLSAEDARAIAGAFKEIPIDADNVGMRLCPSGAYAGFAVTAASTWQTKIAIAQGADAIQLVYSQAMNDAGTTLPLTVSANVSSVSDLTGTPASVNPASPLAVTFDNGGTSKAIAPPSGLTTPSTTKRRAFYLSDVMPLSTVDRTDGGTLPIVVVRTYATAAVAVTTLMGGWSNLASGWASHASGRIWENRYLSGDQRLSSYATMQAAALSNVCPLAGIIYYARGQVINVAGFGDSLTSGEYTTGDNPMCEGFIFPAVNELSDISGVALEYSNLAWGGANYFEIQSMFNDAMSANLPIDIAILPSWTPNGISGPTWITAAIVGRMRQMAALLQAGLRGRRIQPILWTGLPTNPTTATPAGNRDFGATDSLRRTHAANVRTWINRGIPVVDFEPTASGTTDGAGQTLIVAGGTLDGVHPTQSLNASLAAKLKVAIKRFVPRANSTLF